MVFPAGREKLPEISRLRALTHALMFPLVFDVVVAARGGEKKFGKLNGGLSSGRIVDSSFVN